MFTKNFCYFVIITKRVDLIIQNNKFYVKSVLREEMTDSYCQRQLYGLDFQKNIF